MNLTVCVSVGETITRLLWIERIQLPEKYKENFDVSSRAPVLLIGKITCAFILVNIKARPRRYISLPGSKIQK